MKTVKYTKGIAGIYDDLIIIYSSKGGCTA